MASLEQALEALKREPRDRRAKEHMGRRLYALRSAASVLGFRGVARALAEARQVLESHEGLLDPDALNAVSKLLEDLPSKLEAPVSASASANVTGDAPLKTRASLQVLVFGAPFIAEILEPSAQRLECVNTEDFTKAMTLLRDQAPNVVLLDSGARQARELLRAMTRDAFIDETPVLVLTPTDDAPKEPWQRLGARKVLGLPVSPEKLLDTILELTREGVPTALIKGDERLDLTAVAEHFQKAVVRGIIEDAIVDEPDLMLDLEKGSAITASVWHAIASLRKAIAEASNGQVRFRNTGPEGGVILEGFAQARGPLGGEGPILLEGRRVVVADDDPAILWLISDLLRTQGLEVFEAQNGQRALELARELWPDLVMTDILMPRLDGLELCREIKHDLALRDVPVMLLSWKEDFLRRALDLGVKADGYLEKESHADVFMDRVREVLRPKARVEARIALSGRVSGRLEGLSPRWLLTAARTHLANAKVVIRDAAYTYEVALRNGEPWLCLRTSAEGEVERGREVLSAFLGVSAGRFELSEEQTSIGRELFGSLEEELEPLLGRSRELSRRLLQNTALNLEAVELDSDMVRGYLPSTPLSARRLVERLLAGSSPRDLVLSGEYSQGALYAVLWDLHRHGAIRDVRALDMSLCVPESVPAATGFSFQLSPEPARVISPLDPSSESDAFVPSDLGAAVLALAVNETPNPRTASPVEPVQLKVAGEAPLRHEAPQVTASAETSRPAHEEPFRAETSQEEPVQDEPLRAEPAGQQPTSQQPLRAEPAGQQPTSQQPLRTEPAGQQPTSQQPLRAEPSSGEPLRQAETQVAANLEAEAPPAPSWSVEAGPREPEDSEAVEAAIAAVALGAEPDSALQLEPAPEDPAASAGDADPQAPPKPRVSIGGRALGWCRAGAPPLAAALVAFGAVRWVIAPQLEPLATADAEPEAKTASAAAAPTAEALPKVEKLPTITVEEPPPGIPVPKGLGLLLIETSGRHRLYLDGDFIGLGPKRYAQLPPGEHRVGLKLPGADQEFPVTITPSKLTRVIEGEKQASTDTEAPKG